MTRTHALRSRRGRQRLEAQRPALAPDEADIADPVAGNVQAIHVRSRSAGSGRVGQRRRDHRGDADRRRRQHRPRRFRGGRVEYATTSPCARTVIGPLTPPSLATACRTLTALPRALWSGRTSIGRVDSCRNAASASPGRGSWSGARRGGRRRAPPVRQRRRARRHQRRRRRRGATHPTPVGSASRPATSRKETVPSRRGARRRRTLLGVLVARQRRAACQGATGRRRSVFRAAPAAEVGLSTVFATRTHPCETACPRSAGRLVPCDADDAVAGRVGDSRVRALSRGGRHDPVETDRRERTQISTK